MSAEPTRTRVLRLPTPWVWAIGVNAVLLLALGAHALDARVAHAAQVDGLPERAPYRPEGRYLAVGGEISGGAGNAVWILDEVNEELIAVRWNPSRSQLEVIGYRDLRADTTERPAR